MTKTMFPTLSFVETKPIGGGSGIDDKKSIYYCLRKVSNPWSVLTVIWNRGFFSCLSACHLWRRHGMISKQIQAKHFHLSVYHGSIILCRSLCVVSSESTRRLFYSSVTDVSFSLLPLLWAMLLTDFPCWFFGRERRWQQRQHRTNAATTKIRTPRNITIIDIDDNIASLRNALCLWLWPIARELGNCHRKENN